MGTINEELRDRAIRHAIALGQYGDGRADKVVRLLNGADADILGRLAAGLADQSERGLVPTARAQVRLQKLLSEVGALNGAIYSQVLDVLSTELDALAGAEAGFQRDALRAAVGADLGFALPAPARLRAIVEASPIEGRLLASWTEGMSAARLDRLGAALRLGMAQGEATDQLVARVRGTKAARYADGVLDISRRSAQSIVRTSVTHVSNVAAQETWRENVHVVKAWQFLATLDARTTTTCGALDGQTFSIGEGPVPPRHIRCRSISVAVTRGYRELGVDRDELPAGKRASMDGQVAGRTSYSDWLAKRSPAQQDEALGPTRARLFRSGELSLRDMVASDGRRLTLEQLRARYGDLLS